MKVLDLSCDVAGRFAAKLFADGGDEVLRPSSILDDGNALAEYLDSGKKACQLVDLPLRISECDLIFTSFDRGEMLGPAANLVLPQNAVRVTTSSFGQTGPYSSWRGGSMADWAAGGYLFITGKPDREPLSGPENLCAYAAGYTAALAAEAALIERTRTGRGRHVDISTMESMLLLHQSTFSRTAAGQLRRRTGRYTEVYPLTVLPCRDGYVSIGVVSDSEFDKLAIAIGKPELSFDPRFLDRQARWKHSSELDQELGPYLQANEAEAIVRTLQENGIACAKVADPVEVTRNPQLASRGYWLPAPKGGVMPGYPLAKEHPFLVKAEAQPAPARRQEQPLPLSGFRVLDFTIFWAGPSATRTLADLGADVIWVERPGARLDTSPSYAHELSALELQLYLHDFKMFRGKRSIALDLQNAEDRDIAQRLAQRADILVENFRPGVAERLGIGPKTLSQRNPLLTYVSLSGWGADGPWANWRSYGPSIEAASSIQARTGYDGGEPMRLGHTLPDGIGGLVGALSALRGCRRKMEGGGGSWFDISQLEAYVAISGEGIIEASRGVPMPRVGNRSRSGAIQGVFPCLGDDNWIAIRLEGDQECQSFSNFTGIPFTQLHIVDRAETEISRHTRSFDKFELSRRLQAVGVEAFPVMNAEELAEDPHLNARGFFVSVEVHGQRFRMPGTPLRADPAMTSIDARAPRPDQHSSQIREEAELF